IGTAGRWIHFGLTSSDLLDTALALRLRAASDLLLARIERLLAIVRRRALEHRDTICMGRTHGVHAEPTTFGHKLALWAFELDRDAAQAQPGALGADLRPRARGARRPHARARRRGALARTGHLALERRARDLARRDDGARLHARPRAHGGRGHADLPRAHAGQ